MGLPKLIKTDNGPSYISNNFTSFCKEFGIEDKPRIPITQLDKELLNVLITL